MTRCMCEILLGNFPRYRVVEDYGYLRVEVPRDRVVDAIATLGPDMPMNVMFVVAPLAWWRCRLRRRQWIQQFVGERWL